MVSHTTMVDISINLSSLSARAFEKFWQIRRIVNLLATRDLKPIGIGLKQALLIYYLNREGSTSQAQLARFTGSDPAAIARAVHTLLNQGWIVQKDDHRDRRRHTLVLTARGKALARQISEMFQRLEERFSTALSKEESETLTRLLDKILGGFNQTA